MTARIDAKSGGLLPHEMQGLRFLLNGPDTPGIVDSEETLAAVLTFSRLVNRGLVTNVASADGPTFYITPAGRAWLTTWGRHDPAPRA